MARVLNLVTAPTSEPVTLTEAKAQCRVDETEDDALIAALIASARGWAENFKASALITQTWELRVGAFPVSGSGSPWGRIAIPMPPLQSVTSVKYIDQAGVLQTWSATEYDVHGAYTPAAGVAPVGPDPAAAWIEPKYGLVYPITRSETDAVRITFVAGFGDQTQVPQRYKQAILMRVGQLYAQREPVITGTIVSDTKADEALLWPPSFR